MSVHSASPDSSFSSAEVEQFDRQGFIILRGLASRELCERLRAIALDSLSTAVEPIEYEADMHYPGSPVSRDSRGGRTARRLLQARARNELFHDWAIAPSIVARLKQLLGPNPMLAQAHHNCIMTKDPRFSSQTGWHQDMRFWSYQRPELVSTWLALGREDENNGCLQLLPGSQTMRFERDRFDDALFFRQDIAQNRELLAHSIHAELDAGDVLFFHCRLLHAAGWNRTTETKLSLVYTYHAADNRPLPDTRSASLASLALG